MVIINGIKFYGHKCFCGECAAWNNSSTHLSQKDSGKGHCLLFDKMKNEYDKVPIRCKKIFDKAYNFPEGTELVITTK